MEVPVSTPNLGDSASAPTSLSSHSRLSCTPCRVKKQRCDRGLPVCDRCASVGLTCAYPSARKTHVGKPKQVRDLEAKLLQLESRLDNIGSGTGIGDGTPTPETIPVTTDADHAPSSVGSGEPAPWLRGAASNLSQPDSPSINGHYDEGFNDDGQQIPSPSPAIQAINYSVSTDLHERLTTLYFDKCFEDSPMIHRSRYVTSLSYSPTLQPPQFLQYAVMATGASVDVENKSLATILYQQARTLAEADEVKESETDQPSVAHAQCWLLLANLEAQNGMFARAFLSLGRSIRYAQMLNLHQLDQGEHRQSLFCRYSPPRDWAELEERRRTWWVIYISDRLVFSTSGMPAVIDDRQVHTLLPAGEEAFDKEEEEPSISLCHALRKRSMPNSRLACRVIASNLYYRAIDLESRLSPDEDYSGGEKVDEFWSRQQDIDQDLMFVLLQLPQALRLPRNSKCECAIFVNVLLHTANMCLHKTTIRKARSVEGPDAEYIRRQSQSRMLAAAGQILAIFRLSQDLVNTLRNPIQDYAAYIAALMFLEDFAGSGNMESRRNVAFLFNTLSILSGPNPVARMLAAQLSAELERLGIIITPEFSEIQVSPINRVGNTPN